MKLIGFERTRPLIFSLFLIFFLFCFVPLSPAQTMEAWFLAQYGSSGTHTLIRGPNGKVVLFDEGGGADSAAACKAILNSLKIKKIDVAIASHYDSDHIGGLDDLVGLMGQSFFGAFYDRGGTTTHDGASISSAYLNAVAGKRSTVTLNGSKDINLGSGAMIRFLSVGAPNTTNAIYVRGRPTVTTGVSENNKSITCLVSFSSYYGSAGSDQTITCLASLSSYYGPASFDLYLGGDAEGTNELAVDDVVKALGRKVDVLLVDHHGADTNNISSSEFLNNLDPEVAVISVWNNSHGHPRKTTVQRLQAVVEPKNQRIIRLWPGDTANSLCAPETMNYCRTTGGHLKISTNGRYYTVSGPRITEAGLVNHCVDENLGLRASGFPDRDGFIDSGDYDGDGISDIAVFRPDSGLWAVRDITQFTFAAGSGLPVSGDYNGDGTTDAAVFEPASGLWAVRDLTALYFGSGAGRPVPADYDGDGITDAATFSPSSGLWAIRDLTRLRFGTEGDIPVPGDYNGDGIREVAVFRPSSGLWLVRGLTRFYFGRPSDLPVPGNYDSGRGWEPAIFRPSSGLWLVRGLTGFYFGGIGDTPVPGNYEHLSRSTPGIFRPSSGLWSVRGLTRLCFGAPGDIPVTR